MTKPSGYILWEGASLLDGKPIVAIALVGSNNSKTGKMVQILYIRTDIDPISANKNGEDYSICGDCKLRGKAHDRDDRATADERVCYVMLLSILSIWKTYKAGKYPRIKTSDFIEVVKDRYVRLGMYGDPACVPKRNNKVWIRYAKGHTAYSHQANTVGADYDPSVCMRSADTLDEARESWAKGERTFRVGHLTSMVKDKEILCPASEEAGRRTTCDKCKLCSGMTINAKSILIPAHGSGKKWVA
tara:strand:+ start:507 stop:1241 length:735 start_codon:yes stop_codon:yes gene_type:complete